MCYGSWFVGVKCQSQKRVVPSGNSQQPAQVTSQREHGESSEEPASSPRLFSPRAIYKYARHYTSLSYCSLLIAVMSCSSRESCTDRKFGSESRSSLRKCSMTTTRCSWRGGKSLDRLGPGGNVAKELLPYHFEETEGCTTWDARSIGKRGECRAGR